MRFIELYEEHLYESTTDGTIEAFIETTRIAGNLGVFTTKLFKEVKHNFTDGVRMSLENETFNLPRNAHKQFLGYVEELMTLVDDTKTLPEFLAVLIQIAEVKENVVKRMQDHIQESNRFKQSIDWIKDGLNNTKESAMDWWNSNIEKISYALSDLLVKFILELFDLIAIDMKEK